MGHILHLRPVSTIYLIIFLTVISKILFFYTDVYKLISAAVDIFD